jgi:adenosylcobinamide kinase/adenosylcobinamide-phosphate guanylyltransferase
VALVVITGGARSGKSAAATRAAERRSLDSGRVDYVVFGQASDDEMAARIARHRSDRPGTFRTLEPADPTTWIEDDGGTIVLDCLGTLLGRVMEDMWPQDAGRLADAGALPPGYEQRVAERFLAFVHRLSERTGDTIVVTNEVGMGVVPPYATGRLFRDMLGLANRSLVERADFAYVAVAGRLLELTAASTDVVWPED